jgi:hypothetical protein
LSFVMLYLSSVIRGSGGRMRGTERAHHMMPLPITGANATPLQPRCGNQVQPPAAGCCK